MSHNIQLYTYILIQLYIYISIQLYKYIYQEYNKMQYTISQSLPLDSIIEFITKESKDQDAVAFKQTLVKGSKFNRIYGVKLEKAGFMSTYFQSPLNYGNEPYFCPDGWMRCSLDVGLTKQQFAEKYKEWPVCYHGTSPQAAFAIVSKGFKSFNGCWIQKHEKAIYVSPSIIYASHPRYSKIQKYKGKFIQLILQARIRKSLFVKKPGTLQNAFANSYRVDLHYDNNVLEWVCKWNKDKQLTRDDGIIVYGIMLRITSEDPHSPKQNKWYSQPMNV